MVYYWTVRLKHKRTFHLSWTQEFSRVVLQDVSENSNCCLRARWTKLNTQIDFSLCCILIICCYKDHRKISNHLVGATGDLTKENSKITIKKKKTFCVWNSSDACPCRRKSAVKGLFFSIIFTRVTAEGGERGERARGQEERIKRDCLKVKVSLEVRSSFEKTSTSTERKKKKKKINTWSSSLNFYCIITVL